jgi:hypothetical protein
VRAYIDRNKSLGIDPSEPWDSLSVSLTDSVRTNLVIFTHDTVPPRIRDVAADDSLTLRVTFDKAVDPTQTLTVANFAVIAPDSSPVPIVRAGAPPKDTAAGPNPAALVTPTDASNAAAAANRAAGVSPAGRAPIRRDTVVATRPVMPRPIPISEAVIKLQHPLTAKLAYHVRAIGIRGLLGRTGDSERTYTAPAPRPPLAPAPKPGPVTPTTPPPVKK